MKLPLNIAIPTEYTSPFDVVLNPRYVTRSLIRKNAHFTCRVHPTLQSFLRLATYINRQHRPENLIKLYSLLNTSNKYIEFPINFRPYNIKLIN